ncbi:unnamed protein product [Cuscuta epithymum]|uniref:PSP proline-rich domain-containing protein n=1 Tax=Cuscuta epithymum TaxID=186058 RepID=A0AAV0DVR2_9ASTE|nr:unnamed protein product [Cuscuta epithymum]
METEDTINLPILNESGIEPENDGGEDYDCKPSLALLYGANTMDKGANGEVLENGGNDGIKGNHFSLASEDGKFFEKVASFSSVIGENGFVSVQDEINIDDTIGGQQQEQSPNIDRSAPGAKRPRTALGEEQPSVHVIYNALTSERKHKLEEVLQQWSQWCAEHSHSIHDAEVLEAGEKTYFPALRVGMDNKTSAVSFWMDLPRKKKNKVFTPFDANSGPIYDRGVTIALNSSDGSNNLEGISSLTTLVEASRCFNCNSYSHSMKDCKKPRDSVAVNSARKQHRSKLNLNAVSRIRYYQSSERGKYDGLSPGILDAETRKLLGLGELDPPPWLHRMREIGYPPGYLDPEEDNLPSGITIFGNDETTEEADAREILERSAEPPKKMSVRFPGINAPIPENVDKRHWGVGPSSSIASRARSYRRHANTTPDTVKRGHDLEQQGIFRIPTGPQRSRSFEEEGPPPHQFRSIEDEGLVSQRFRDFEAEGCPRQWFRDFEEEASMRKWVRSINNEGPLNQRFRDLEAEGCPTQWFRDFEDESPMRMWHSNSEEEARRHGWYRGGEGEGDPRRQLGFNDEWRHMGHFGEIDPFSYRHQDYYDSNCGVPIDGFRRSLSDRARRSPLAADDGAYLSLSYPRYR